MGVTVTGYNRWSYQAGRTLEYDGMSVMKRLISTALCVLLTTPAAAWDES